MYPVESLGAHEYRIFLDPAMPYLADHDVGVPLFGTVLSLEAMAEAVFADTGKVASVIRNIVSGEDCLVPEAKQLHCSIQILKDTPEIEYASVILKDMQKLVFQCEMGFQRWEEEEHLQKPPASGPVIDKEEIYQTLFHGPAFQVLHRVYPASGRMVGEPETNLPPLLADGSSPTLLPVRMIEFCLQTSGLWDLKFRNAMRVPLGIRRIDMFGPDPVHIRPSWAIAAGLEDRSDITACDRDGRVVLRVQGYQTKEMPYPAHPA